MKKSKIWIFIMILFLIILIVFFIFIKGKNAIKNIVTEKYPEYEIVDKKYQYLDHFWHTWYDSAGDNFFLDMECYVTLKNKETGMYITVPFSHSRFGFYKENSNGSKKDMGQVLYNYEKFWNEVNDFSKKNVLEVHLSNVELSDSNNCDIRELIIYIKEEDSMDSQEIINNIDKIDTNLECLSHIKYVVAKEKAFDELYPWIQSDIDKITLSNDNVEYTKDEQNYDFYVAEKQYKDGNIDTRNLEIEWVKEYYIYK